MIKAILQKSTGESLTLDIPVHGSEVCLGQALDFKVECLHLIDWLKDNADQLEEKRWQYVILIVKCLKAFYGDIAEFMDLDSKYLENISSKDILEHLSLITEKDKNITEAYDSLVQIFNLVYRAVNDCKPVLRDTKTIEYKGKRYQMPTIWHDTLWKRTNFESISVKQAIEVLQVQADYAEVIKDLAGDQASATNYLFTKYLSELAILLVPEGKEIPLEETAFKKYMTEQMAEFQDIDLQTAIDIEHWFHQYYESLKADKENHYFFNSKEPTSAEELKAQKMAQAKNEDVIRRIGWKSIINRLVEIGAFNGRAKTSIESVMTAPFTDAVKVVSIDNAK